MNYRLLAELFILPKISLYLRFQTEARQNCTSTSREINKIRFSLSITRVFRGSGDLCVPGKMFYNAREPCGLHVSDIPCGPAG